MVLHPSLTVDRIVRAAKCSMFGDNVSTGFCTTCGRKAKQSWVEPDARNYPCLFKSCGQPTVFGAEELLLEVTP